MKKIKLGLDLGVSSIGWAVTQGGDQENPLEILDLGSRIIHYHGTEGEDFTKGVSKTRNQERTLARGARRGNSRYKGLSLIHI